VPVADHQDGEGDEDPRPGQLLEVLATDPGSVADFKAWAQSTGNPLVQADQSEGVYRYVLKKKEF